MNQFSQAFVYIRDAMDACGSDCGDFERMNAEYALGMIWSRMDSIHRAKEHLRTAYAIAVETGNSRFQLDILHTRARIALAASDVRATVELLRSADSLIHLGNSNNLEKLKIYSALVEAYKASGDERLAAIYQDRHTELRDSLYSEAFTTNLMRIEAEFMSHESREKVASQEEVLVLKEEIIQRKTKVNVLLWVLACISTSLVFVVWRGYRRKNATAKMLDDRVRERTREIELTVRALTGERMEREMMIKRLASELSAGLKNLLVLSDMGLRATSDPDSRDFFVEIEKTTNDLLSDIRLNQTNVNL